MSRRRRSGGQKVMAMRGWPVMRSLRAPASNASASASCRASFTALASSCVSSTVRVAWLLGMIRSMSGLGVMKVINATRASGQGSGEGAPVSVVIDEAGLHIGDRLITPGTEISIDGRTGEVGVGHRRGRRPEVCHGRDRAIGDEPKVPIELRAPPEPPEGLGYCYPVDSARRGKRR